MIQFFRIKSHTSQKGTLPGESGVFYGFKKDTGGRVVASFRYDKKASNGMTRGSSGHYFTGYNSDHITIG